MDYGKDKRIVMTLDAGGTNHVISAIQENEQIIKEIIFLSYADNFDKCLSKVGTSKAIAIGDYSFALNSLSV